eukprot:12933836-Alexandrium_andersonii.AAC.1
MVEAHGATRASVKAQLLGGRSCEPPPLLQSAKCPKQAQTQPAAAPQARTLRGGSAQTSRSEGARR